MLDAQLFLVRHLLILKEMTQNLDFAQSNTQPNIDLGGVTGALLCCVIAIEDIDCIHNRNVGLNSKQNNVITTGCVICITWDAEGRWKLGRCSACTLIRPAILF